MKFSVLYLMAVVMSCILFGCGHREDDSKQPHSSEQFSSQGESINAFSITYAIEDLSSATGFKSTTFTIDDPEKVRVGIAAIKAIGYLPETHSSTLPFNKISFLGENGTKQEATFIKPDLLEMGRNGIQKMTPVFYEWACKTASEHAEKTIELLKIN